jgi:chromosome segregation ATPase
MADDGPRQIPGAPGTVTDREFLMAQLHALDERLSQKLDARAERVDERFRDLQQRGDERLKSLQDSAHATAQANDKAISIASKAMEQWQVSQNEFRAQSKDKDASLATLVELNAKFMDATSQIGAVMATISAAVKRIEVIEQKNSNMDGRYWALGVGLTFMVFAINAAFHFIGK